MEYFDTKGARAKKAPLDVHYIVINKLIITWNQSALDLSHRLYNAMSTMPLLPFLQEGKAETKRKVFCAFTTVDPSQPKLVATIKLVQGEEWWKEA